MAADKNILDTSISASFAVQVHAKVSYQPGGGSSALRWAGSAAPASQHFVLPPSQQDRISAPTYPESKHLLAQPSLHTLFNAMQKSGVASWVKVTIFLVSKVQSSISQATSLAQGQEMDASGKGEVELVEAHS